MSSWVRRMRRDEGFTLVELLLVIIIIGILIGIVVLGIATFRQQAESACTEANNRTLATAQAAYRANFPGSNPTQAQLVSAGYIEALPDC